MRPSRQSDDKRRNPRHSVIMRLHEINNQFEIMNQVHQQALENQQERYRKNHDKPKF